MGKGKRMGFAVGVVLGLSLIPGSVMAGEEADQGYGHCVTRKLGRGVANILSAPFEIIRVPSLKGGGVVSETTVGVVQGVGAFIVRELAGIVETVTFPVPLGKKGFEPLVQPEFIYANGDWVS